MGKKRLYRNGNIQICAGKYCWRVHPAIKGGVILPTTLKVKKDVYEWFDLETEERERIPPNLIFRQCEGECGRVFSDVATRGTWISKLPKTRCWDCTIKDVDNQIAEYKEKIKCLGRRLEDDHKLFVDWTPLSRDNKVARRVDRELLVTHNLEKTIKRNEKELSTLRNKLQTAERQHRQLRAISTDKEAFFNEEITEVHLKTKLANLGWVPEKVVRVLPDKATLKDLTEMTAIDLLKRRTIGRKTVEEICTKLEAKGLCLKHDPNQSLWALPS